MLIDSNTAVPDRQRAILLGGDDPGPVIGAMGKGLESAGADFLVMPCNSAHAFLGPLLEQTSIPLLSIVGATVAACNRFDAVGIMATDGCLEFGGYQAALNEKQIRPIVPTNAEAERLMTLINLIKAGDKSTQVSQPMAMLAQNLINRGANAIVAGCTEIPLVLADDALTVPIVSSTDMLARATVAQAFGMP